MIVSFNIFSQGTQNQLPPILHKSDKIRISDRVKILPRPVLNRHFAKISIQTGNIVTTIIANRILLHPLNLFRRQKTVPGL